MNSKSKQPTQTSPSKRWAIWLGSLVGAIGVLALVLTQQTVAADVVVYKSPTCGCCGKWVEHMENSGFIVDVEDMRDVAPIKRELGVPRRMQSCHTAKVGDYFVEGHVPADLVKQLLADKPDIKGLTVPGMPMGSPGMEGPRKDPYNVIAIEKDGRARVYARR